ncbi:hypothetical protein [Mycobacterium sp. 852002-50816_SCH5313054-b]|uniref:hypothetical protein n=1 Tax=Mycobacterium sp. 852002-50816_SCH5313054-b TaxID=1834092 RepID=UPI0009ED2CBF|nr:hypothetical protein [Mycobacterium sp. 852002-50816_SCH5313054-b]
MSRLDDIDAGAERVCQLVGSLPIPEPWHLKSFIEVVADKRGKPIRLIPHPGLFGSGQPCGIWIGRRTDDIIVYDDTTSSYHVEHIVLHELGHLLLQHRSSPGSDAAALSIQELLPDVDPATVLHVLGRTAYDNEQESQAELFASFVMSESRKSRPASKFLSTFLRD